MTIEKVKVAKRVEGKELEYALNNTPSRTIVKNCEKFIGKKINSLTIIKVFSLFSETNRRSNYFLLKCICPNCNNYHKIEEATIRKEKANINLHCNCSLDKQIKEVQEIFHIKHEESEENNKYCSYCESWRPESYFNGKGRYCDCCNYVSCYKVKVGLSFEDIMRDWNPETHKPDTKKLPYFKGNNTKGYTVRGFTYVDSDKYEKLSQVLWIFTSGYVKTNYSKENLIRLGKEEDYIPIKERDFHNHTPLQNMVLGIRTGHVEVGDHIKGYTLDNRFINLRVADINLNCRNSRKTKKITSSVYKGVTWRDRDNNWGVQTMFNGVYKNLGKFKEEEDAARAYDNYLRSLDLEGSLFNFPLEEEGSVFR